ncbi:MAG: hypothetical protein ACI3XY_05800 [Butyricicoccaceae bacterium]
MSLQQSLKKVKNLGIIYSKGQIPLKKLRNAKQEYGGFQPENVLYLTDQTVFGSAKRGIAITSEGIHGKFYGDAFHISFAAIGKLRVSGGDSVEAVGEDGRVKQRVRIGVGDMSSELTKVYREARQELYGASPVRDDDVTEKPEWTKQSEFTVPDPNQTVPEQYSFADLFAERLEDLKPGDLPL